MERPEADVTVLREEDGKGAPANAKGPTTAAIGGGLRLIEIGGRRGTRHEVRGYDQGTLRAEDVGENETMEQGMTEGMGKDAKGRDRM